MTQLLPPKKEVALALLERSNVDIYLDPRADGVVVPPQFRKEPRLILKIGLNMPVPIPDLRLDDESMSCTLSFNRAKFYCVVPWSSVFAMVGDDGRGMVWPDDVPQELSVKAEDGERGEHGERVKKPQLTSAPSLVRDARDVTDAPGPVSVPSSRSGKGKSRIQPDAETSPSSDRKTAAKRSSSKKKKEEAARPMLHAVPSLSPRVEKLSDRREEKREEREREQKDQKEKANAVPSPSPMGPMTPPAPAARPAASGPPSGRPKRELPPYLRVVK